MRSLVLVAVVAWAACPSQLPAGEPAAESPAAATSAPAAAPDKAATNASAQAAPTPAAAKPAVAAADKKEEYKPPLGYKKERRDGVDLYCRRDVESGSRFTQKTCYTQADLEYVIERNKTSSDELIRATRVCATGSTCSNN